MDCERFDKTSMELLYGELDELSEAAALRHLHHCTRCRDIWGHLRTTREIAELPLEEPPEDLFRAIIQAEAAAQRSLPARERFSRAISVLAGYAMRPQLAMAAILLLMIGSSLVFVRSGPGDPGHVSVTEGGTPFSDTDFDSSPSKKKMVFQGEPRATAADDPAADQPSEAGNSSESTTRQTYNAAMNAYQSGRYAEAERLFSEVASAGGEQAGSAALHEGHAARNGSGCQRAAALYDAVAARHMGRTVSDEASWHAASCYRAMGQNQRAAAHYEKLEKRPAFGTRAKVALAELSPGLDPPTNSEGDIAAKGNAKTAAGPTEKTSAPTSQSAGASNRVETKAKAKPSTTTTTKTTPKTDGVSPGLPPAQLAP